MEFDVLEARYVGGYTLWLRFRDGTSGDVDLGPELNGEVFEPLRNLNLFRRFYVHPEARTLFWPNGADFAPEFLHEKCGESVTKPPISPLS